MTTDGVIALETTVVSGDVAYVWAPAGEAALPLVVLVHGSHVHPLHYSRYAIALALDGFVVVAPEHVRDFFGDRAHYPQQAVVNWAIEWATAETRRDGSPLFGRIDVSRVLLTGHSMGGGVTLGVASDFAQPGLVVDEWSTPAELVAAVVHGTHNIPPPRTGDPLPIDNRVPLAFVHGTADGVVTLEQARRTFQVVHGVVPRLMVELEGGNHFFLTDSDNPEGVNPDRNSPPPLDQSTAIASAARWTALWFHANLGDEEARAALRRGAEGDEQHVSVLLVESSEHARSN